MLSSIVVRISKSISFHFKASRGSRLDLESLKEPLVIIEEVRDDNDDESVLETDVVICTEQEPLRSNTSVLRKIAYVVLNIASALCLTYINKIVVEDEQLSRCQISYAAFSFFSTFVFLFLSSLTPFNLFPRIRIPIVSILPLCILFGGFLILGNLSLEYNDMAFYSLARLMTCPTVVLLNFFLFRSVVSNRTLLSIIVLTIGVIIANGQFGIANPFGASIAILAFVTTAMYQILIGRSIHGLKVSAPQLLLNQAPLAALLLLAIVPIIDKQPDLQTIPIRSIIAFCASGVVAPLFNISQFLIIGSTSALTFNVIGMAKLAGNLIMSWAFQQRFPSAVEITGVVMAMSGTWLYASVKDTALPIKRQADVLEEK